MSEELLNVEDDGPDPATIPEPAAPIAAAPEVPPAAPEEEDPTSVDLRDIPKVSGLLAALKSERESNKALKEKASRAEQLEAYVNESRPYVEFLKNNPDLLKPRQAPPAPQPSPVQDVDPQAEEMARLLDLYTPEGQPDLKRAQKFLKVVDTKAAQQAQAVVAPVHARSAQEQSNANFNLALTYKDPAGRSPSRDALAAVWRSMDPSQTADPHVASILTLTALGMDYANTKPQPQAPQHAPLVTEGSGSAPARPNLSRLEASIARDRGVKESTWQDFTKGFQPGRPQQLED